jgi:RND family efflux transporter MFP subunit
MRDRAVGSVLKGVRTLIDVGTSVGLSDGQLLERYLRLRGEDAAEAAFRALVERHGPMVLRACRGVLHDVHAAEDAFQATFLVLARKARSIRQRESVASWLFGVARRVATRADAQRKRRASLERQGVAMAEAEANAWSVDHPPEPTPEVQEEVDRLPERYRAPIVLCYLEGLTQEEAAIRLRLPASTVRVRLMRARSRLRDRLTRRGLAPAVLAAVSAGRAEAAVPAPLVEETIKAAVRVAVGRAAGVSAPVAALVEGVMRAMFLAKLKTAAALLAALMLASLAMISSLAGSTPPRQDPPAANDRPAGAKAPPKAEGPEVTVATAKRSRLERKSHQPGTLVAFDSADLYAKVSGYLTSLRVDIGSRVKRGEVLAEIYEPELVSAVEKARAEFVRAKVRISKAQAAVQVAQAAVEVEQAKVQAATAALEEAEARAQPQKRKLENARGMAQRKVVSQDEVGMAADEYLSSLAGSKTARSQLLVARAAEAEARAKIVAAQADVDEAKSELEIAKAGLDQAQAMQAYTRIVSPYDGIVTRRNYHVGALVGPANAANVAPIATVVRSDVMRVVVPVPENDAPYLDLGDRATVRIDALGARGVYQGVISRSAYAIDPKARSLLVETDLPNRDGLLRPGQSAQVEISLETRENVLTIPTSAIIGRHFDGAAVCYRVVDGRAVRTPIKLDLDNFLRVQVLEGLEEGDVVIVDPNVPMPDGQTVTIRRDADKPADR